MSSGHAEYDASIRRLELADRITDATEELLRERHAQMLPVLRRGLQICFGAVVDVWPELDTVWFDHEALRPRGRSMPAAILTHDRLVSGTLPDPDSTRVAELFAATAQLLPFCKLRVPAGKCLRIDRHGMGVSDRPGGAGDFRTMPPTGRPALPGRVAEALDELDVRLVACADAWASRDSAWVDHGLVCEQHLPAVLASWADEMSVPSLRFCFDRDWIGDLYCGISEMQLAPVVRDALRLRWSQIHPGGALRAALSADPSVSHGIAEVSDGHLRVICAEVTLSRQNARRVPGDVWR